MHIVQRVKHLFSHCAFLFLRREWRHFLPLRVLDDNSNVVHNSSRQIVFFLALVLPIDPGRGLLPFSFPAALLAELLGVWRLMYALTAASSISDIA